MGVGIPPVWKCGSGCSRAQNVWNAPTNVMEDEGAMEYGKNCSFLHSIFEISVGIGRRNSLLIFAAFSDRMSQKIRRSASAPCGRTPRGTEFCGKAANFRKIGG
jgi:hypothetical protein